MESKQVGGAGMPGNSTAQTGGDGVVILAALLLQNFRILALITFAGVVLALLMMLFLPNVYRSEVSYIPSSRLEENSGVQLPSSLRGASSLMGISVGGPGQDISTLLAQIARRRSFAKEMLEVTLVLSDSSHVTLAKYLNPEFGGTNADIANLVRYFRHKIIKVGFDDKSGITTIGIESKDPAVALQIAKACESGLDRFYNDMVDAQQDRVVEYLDQQLSASAEHLQDAEDELQRFVERNSVLQDSPSLQFELARLKRKIEVRESVFLGLSNQLEARKFESFRNMPSIVVIDDANLPVRPVKPNRPLLLVAAILFAFFIGLVFLLLREGRRRFYLHANQTWD